MSQSKSGPVDGPHPRDPVQENPFPPEHKRRKKISPKQFAETCGPAIRVGRMADRLPETFKQYQAAIKGEASLSHSPDSRTAILEAYGSPIPWRQFDLVSIGDLMQRIGYHSSPIPVEALRKSWIVTLLSEASRSVEPEAFKALLLELLASLDIRVPEGVLTAWSKPLGRRTDDNTGRIYQTWLSLGKPPVCKQVLAKEVYGSSSFMKDAPDERKKRSIYVGKLLSAFYESCRLNFERLKSGKS